MANKFTYQVLRDTTTDAVIKVTGIFDGTSGNELNVSRISANSLSNALATNGYLLANTQGGAANTALSYYDLQLTGLKYYVNFPVSGTLGSVELFWSGNNTSTAASSYANSATIFHLQGQGEFGLGEQLPSILNNSGTGAANTVGNGDLGIQTTGATNNSAYTLIISVRKNNAMYQRGQFNDPAAFNYGNYGITGNKQ
jgi:hypothetical protein